MAAYGGGGHMHQMRRNAPGAVEAEPCVCELRLHERAAVQRLAEGLPPLHARCGELHSGVADAARTHAVVQAARPEAPLRDLEAAALAKNDVADGHPVAARRCGPAGSGWQAKGGATGLENAVPVVRRST